MYANYVIWDGGSGRLADDFLMVGMGILQWERANLF